MMNNFNFYPIYGFCSKCFALLFLFVVLPVNSASVDDRLPLELKQLLLQGKFKNAANQLETLVAKDNAAAKYQLATLLLSGKGVAQSSTRAEKLLVEAAPFSSEAAFLLGSLYAKGKQLNNNQKLAQKYLTNAAALGNKKASKLLIEIEQRNNLSTRIKPQTQRLFKLALDSGNLSLVIEQYLKGANLNHPDEKGNSPIMTAIILERENVFQWLVKQNINFDYSNKKGEKAIHLATRQNQINNVIAIVKATKNIDQLNHRKQTALMIAIQLKNQTIAQWLINNNANMKITDINNKSALDYNKVANLLLIAPRTKTDENIDNIELRKKQFDYQKKLLAIQSTNKDSPYYKWPAISIAIAQGQKSIALQLMTEGASPWISNNDFDTAISLSLKRGYLETMNTMLSAYPIASQNKTENIERLFLVAVEQENGDIISKSLKQATELNMKGLAKKGLIKAIKEQFTTSTKLLIPFVNNFSSEELLSLSITKEGFTTTQILLGHGISADWQNSNGQTPLIIAAQKSNSEIITLLSEYHVDVDRTDQQGLTALMWATKQDCFSCVQILLANKADSRLTSNTGNNATMFAAQSSVKILELLLSLEPDLSARNSQSLTALMLAVKSNCLRCVKQLLKHGANPRRKNSMGQDSMDLASNNPEILNILTND